jgi:hypothetical protein
MQANYILFGGTQTTINEYGLLQNHLAVVHGQVLKNVIYAQGYMDWGCLYKVCFTTFSGVCEDAYMMVYDVKKRRLNDVKLLFSKGFRKVIHGNDGASKERVGTAEAYGKWFLSIILLEFCHEWNWF